MGELLSVKTSEKPSNSKLACGACAGLAAQELPPVSPWLTAVKPSSQLSREQHHGWPQPGKPQASTAIQPPSPPA